MVQALKAEPALEISRALTDPHDVLVGGTNSAFPFPLSGCIERASGTRIWGESRNEYIDFLLASGPLILGHSHPAVMTAVAEQLPKGTAYYSVNRPAVELAEMLISIPGCAEIVRFASTGTEATMHAIRLARAYTARDKVLVLSGSYHGSHDVSIVGHRGALKAQRGGVPANAVDDVVIAVFGDIDSVHEAFAQHSGEIAAVIVEPQQRSLDPPPGFLEALRDACTANGTVLIFDEVLTGFRLAYGGAQEYYGVVPDIVCYGKIVGGGFPLAAVAGRSDILNLADPARADASDFVHFSGTLSGNPVAAVAGIVTLRELQADGVYEHLFHLGSYLRRGLSDAMTCAGIEGEIIGSGPLAAVHFHDTDGPGSGKLLKSEVNREMIARGILVQLQTRFYISLLHTEEDLDRATDAFAQSLNALGRPVAV